jgi:polysaccharide pyruvyl transferase WcaK-like protein
VTKENKLRIALISAAGLGNYGDELIRKLWLRFYKKHSVVDISFAPISECENADYTFMEKAKLWDFEYAFSGVDLIHFAGGGYINDEFNTISKYTDALSFQEKKIPLVASGISLQPSSLDHTESFFRQNWELMGLRDSTSFLQAREVLGRRASFSFDDTWKFSLKPAMKKVTREERTIFINLQEQFDLAIESEYLAKVEEIADIVLRMQRLEPSLIVVVIEAHKSDLRLAIELEKVGIDSLVVSAEEWLKTGIIFSEQDLLITSRFHPRLLFSRAGVPVKTIVVGTYYQQKHLDASRKIFPYSDYELESEFCAPMNRISLSLWKTRCFAKAMLFKLRLVSILYRIRIKKHFKGNRVWTKVASKGDK